MECGVKIIGKLTLMPCCAQYIQRHSQHQDGKQLSLRIIGAHISVLNKSLLVKFTLLQRVGEGQEIEQLGFIRYFGNMLGTKSWI